MHLAEIFPVAQSIYLYAGFWVAYPLRRNNFRETTRLTVLMTDKNPSAVQSDQMGDAIQQSALPKELAGMRGPFAMIIGLVPAARRLASPFAGIPGRGVGPADRRHRSRLGGTARGKRHHSGPA